MMELPEAQVIAKQMQKILIDKKIIDVIQLHSPHKFAFFNKEIPSYKDILVNKQIQQVHAFGGYVELVIDTYRLAFGDGVHLRYLTHDSEIPKKHQLLLCFSDGTFLVASIQMYGMLWLFKEGNLDNFYYQVAMQKPSPLTDTFSYTYFITIYDATSKKSSIKAFLATKQTIPGLGNGVLQDILYTAKIHPKRKLGSLTKQEIETLFHSVKTTLTTMVSQGGRNTEKDLFGNLGQYPTIVSNKTIKEPCPICHSVLCKQSYLGGSIYFCPTCQPEK